MGAFNSIRHFLGMDEKDKDKDFIDEEEVLDNEDDAEEYEEEQEDIREERRSSGVKRDRGYSFVKTNGTAKRKTETRYSGPRVAKDEEEDERMYTPLKATFPFRVCIIRPKVVNDSKNIGDEMRKGSIVLIDLENAVQTEKQRIVDCTYGISFGMKYNFVPVLMDRMYVCAPQGVEVTGEGIKLKDGEFYRW